MIILLIQRVGLLLLLFGAGVSHDNSLSARVVFFLFLLFHSSIKFNQRKMEY